MNRRYPWLISPLLFTYMVTLALPTLRLPRFLNMNFLWLVTLLAVLFLVSIALASLYASARHPQSLPRRRWARTVGIAFSIVSLLFSSAFLLFLRMSRPDAFAVAVDGPNPDISRAFQQLLLQDIRDAGYHTTHAALAAAWASPTRPSRFPQYPPRELTVHIQLQAGPADSLPRIHSVSLSHAPETPELPTSLDVALTRDGYSAVFRRLRGSLEPSSSHIVLSDNVTANYHALRALASYSRGTRDALHTARDEYALAISSDSTFALAQAGLADTYASLYFRHWSATETTLTSAFRAAALALQLAPDSPQANKSAGLCHLVRGLSNLSRTAQDAIADLQEARIYTERAISLQPNYYLAWSNLIPIYYELNLRDSAITSYKKAARLCPECPDAHLNFSNILIVEGSLQEAEKVLLRLIELAPSFGMSYYNLALLSCKLEDLATARTYYGAALHIGDADYRAIAETDPDAAACLLSIQASLAHK